ncbi:MAG: hypothetical protein GC180_09665 [Bacteroidetes bacterium]|nr:hypothetical protein [Bacteroidota bacterium]
MQTFFFTCVATSRKPIFDRQNLDFINAIIQCCEYFSLRPSFLLHALSIMPNHIHFLYSEIDCKTDFNTRFLRFTTKQILSTNNLRLKHERVSFTSNYNDRKTQVWRPRSKLILVHNKQQYFAVKRYIHSNHLKEFWKGAAFNQKFPSLTFSPRFWD